MIRPEKTNKKATKPLAPLKPRLHKKRIKKIRLDVNNITICKKEDLSLFNYYRFLNYKPRMLTHC